MSAPDLRARALWQAYAALGARIAEAVGPDPFGPQPGDRDPWTALADLTIRGYHGIHSLHGRYPAGTVLTVGQLAEIPDATLRTVQHLGRATLKEIREAIRLHRLHASAQANVDPASVLLADDPSLLINILADEPG